MNYDELDDRAINVLVAVRLGWLSDEVFFEEDDDPPSVGDGITPYYCREIVAPSGIRQGVVETTKEGDIFPLKILFYDEPEFTCDLDAIKMIEDEVERRGLWMEYTASLLKDDIFDGFVQHRRWEPVIDAIVEYAWKALRTTPRQRCIAFLKATEEQDEPE